MVVLEYFYLVTVELTGFRAVSVAKTRTTAGFFTSIWLKKASALRAWLVPACVVQ
jgi:hypothetical protein